MKRPGDGLFGPGGLPRGAVGALLIIFVLLFPLTRPEDPDVWFHLSAGRYVWTNGEYPGMDQFLYTYPADTPSSRHEWLFQVLVYPLYRALGMEALVVAKVLLIGAAFLGLFFTTVTRRSFYPALLYLLVAFAAGSGRFYIKPEIAGALILAIMWSVLSRPLSVRGAVSLVLLQVLWTNLHWSSILGVGLVAAFAAADVFGRLVKSSRHLSTGTSCATAAGYPLLLCAVAASTLVNPDGVRPFLEPFRYFFSTGFLLPVAETWPIHFAIFRKDPTSFQAWYFLALILGILGFAFSHRRLNLAHLFTFSGMALVALSAERHVLFFALISVPIVITSINTFLEERPPLPSPVPQAALALLSAIFLVTLTLNKVTGVSYLSPYPKPYEPLSAGESEFLWPRRAAAFLLDSRLPGRIFNNFNSGNYLNWAVFPRRIFINGTFSHRPTEVAYARIKSHLEEWDSFAEREGIGTVFFRLTPVIAPSPLLRTVIHHPGWKLVYYDGTAAISVRDTPENRELIESFPVDLDKELLGAIRNLLTNGSGQPGRNVPLWRETVQYRWHQDQARIFRLRAQFYLLAGRPDLAAAAAETMRNLLG